MVHLLLDGLWNNKGLARGKKKPGARRSAQKGGIEGV